MAVRAAPRPPQRGPHDQGREGGFRQTDGFHFCSDGPTQSEFRVLGSLPTLGKEGTDGAPSRAPRWDGVPPTGGVFMLSVSATVSPLADSTSPEAEVATSYDPFGSASQGDSTMQYAQAAAGGGGDASGNYGAYESF